MEKQPFIILLKPVVNHSKKNLQYFKNALLFGVKKTIWQNEIKRKIIN